MALFQIVCSTTIVLELFLQYVHCAQCESSACIAIAYCFCFFHIKF